ncbi:MAG TPA: C40 family peptidase [Gaiellaceae bacterium]|jgi:cell wall-associated NlpC family hydrolase|nr:C40 family peptidase [Gaiellaceae bacterium]
MRNTRLLLVLCALAFALAVALARPLPSRADSGDPQTAPPPDPMPPVNVDPIVQQLPVVSLKAPRPVRKPAAVLHHALHVPFGNKVVKYAKHFLGVRYTWGGTSPRSGFDCSGFVRFVYSHFGVGLAHSSFSQFRSGVRVARAGLKPGDLVFFHGVGHVGIYIGGGRFIHAPHTGTRVQIASLGGTYSSEYDGARRIRRATA